VDEAIIHSLKALSPRSRFVEAKGATIHYLHWPNPQHPPLVLIHGHAAHAHWWDAVVLYLRRDFDLYAIDLSGCGDSDHRPVYSYPLFTEEILSLCEDAQISSPILVGHSFGGSIARIACYLKPELAAKLLIVDSVLRPRETGNRARSSSPPKKHASSTRFYASTDQAIRRFRLRPPQAIRHPAYIEHIARHAIKETPQGARFKLDLQLLAHLRPLDAHLDPAAMLAMLDIPKGLITGRHSVFFDPTTTEGEQNLLAAKTSFSPSSWYWVEDAAHHVLLDQPEQTAAVIRRFARQ
jgi:pimeloyl-ACP methyl ester carboxylesterase